VNKFIVSSDIQAELKVEKETEMSRRETARKKRERERERKKGWMMVSRVLMRELLSTLPRIIRDRSEVATTSLTVTGQSLSVLSNIPIIINGQTQQG
jgi:hypothetical protein